MIDPDSIDTPDQALARIRQILAEIAPTAATPLPFGGMDRRLRLAKLRNAGIEIAGLAHWALRPSRRRLPF
jgi:hypothetical protein